MLVTQADAKRIISAKCGITPRLTTKTQVICPPIAAMANGAQIVAFRKLLPGLSMVRIGVMQMDGQIDWAAEI